jgi:hypothetical protein
MAWGVVVVAADAVAAVVFVVCGENLLEQLDENDRGMKPEAGFNNMSLPPG